ncbi:hypothetical protein [Terricaulis silvestris]|uniref:Uncharacterized protein n=1 Tax=Terricaulis silvestris TaxID=2686094 RepID=A0A6I6MFR5_9CAUL|nr:hypothetical protein [Terricaulis silvestris]QGZ93330.1 hypothetical protein DSM104635_00140 [Terricaulis silvestris]
MPTADDVATSLELRFFLDRCFVAHQTRRPDLADIYARAAEAVLRAAFPQLAADIGRTASRKGNGDVIGARLAQHLSARSAAVVATVLTLRGARKPVVQALSAEFGSHPEFVATTKMLCRRVFDPLLATTSTMAPSCAPVLASIEVAAPVGR